MGTSIDRSQSCLYYSSIFSPSDQPVTASDGVFFVWRGETWFR